MNEEQKIIHDSLIEKTKAFWLGIAIGTLISFLIGGYKQNAELMIFVTIQIGIIFQCILFIIHIRKLNKLK